MSEIEDEDDDIEGDDHEVTDNGVTMRSISRDKENEWYSGEFAVGLHSCTRDHFHSVTIGKGDVFVTHFGNVLRLYCTKYSSGQTFSLMVGDVVTIEVIEGPVSFTASKARENLDCADYGPDGLDDLSMAGLAERMNSVVDPVQGGKQSRGINFGDDELGTSEDDDAGFGFG